MVLKRSCGVQQTVSAFVEQAVLIISGDEQTVQLEHNPFLKYCWDVHEAGGLLGGGLESFFFLQLKFQSTISNKIKHQ